MLNFTLSFSISSTDTSSTWPRIVPTSVPTNIQGGKRTKNWTRKGEKKKKRSKRRGAKREIKLNYCFGEPADHIKHTLTRWDEHPKERFDIFPANSSSLPLLPSLQGMLFIFPGKIPLSPFPSSPSDIFVKPTTITSRLFRLRLRYKCIGLMSASSE